MLDDITAHCVDHLPLSMLGHFPAIVVGDGPTGSGDGHPIHEIVLALPVVLAFLQVIIDALSSDVRLILCPVALLTHALLVHSLTLLPIHNLTLKKDVVILISVIYIT